MEVYYDFYRQAGKQGADLAIASVDQAGVILREDMDPAFWEDAGAIKADHRRISIADCFCIALARRVGGEVVTGDHHELDRIVPLGLCPVRFIR
jgi:predicted nucleic acid-binding protein